MATILNLCLEAIEFEHTHQKIKAARKYWLTALHTDVKDMLKIINSIYFILTIHFAQSCCSTLNTLIYFEN